MGGVILLAVIVVVLVWVGLVMALAPRLSRRNLQRQFPATVEPERLWGVMGPSYLTKPVLILWAALQYGPAKFPLWGWVRFDVASARVTFFVRRKVATELLQTAGQPLP